MSTPTADYIRTVLSYTEASGQFIWLQHKKMAGKPAGTVNKRGYVQISIKDRLYPAHRLAWLYMTGSWPTTQIDHKDNIRTNNAWSNLRLATNAENSWNRGAQVNNTTGLKGVKKNRRTTGYAARICVNGRTFYLGVFRTAQEAHLAYCQAAKKYHGEFARSR